MGNLEGLRVLAALEIAEPFKKGISFVTKGVIQVQEAWYGQAMEVAYAANNYSIGPSEIMEVKQAVNSYFREPSEGDTRVKTCRQSSRGWATTQVHEKNVNNNLDLEFVCPTPPINDPNLIPIKPCTHILVDPEETYTTENIAKG
ncbi:hypothetical protein VTO58DRAFT_102738 [Aureobasidium pullulans]